MEQILFGIVSIVSIVSAVLVIVNKNVVHSALFLLINFATISIFYFMLNAQFLGVVQILVYAGAIVVLFLFVVMLLGADLGEEILGWFSSKNIILATLSLLLLAVIALSITSNIGLDEVVPNPQSSVIEEPSGLDITHQDHTRMIGISLFTDHILSVQLAGILLLVGIVGVIWLARNENTQSLTDDVLARKVDVEQATSN